MSNGVTAGPYTDRRSDQQKNVDELGHPGTYIQSVTVAGGAQADFTGSQFGYGAVICAASSDSTITLTNGGTVAAAALIGAGVVDLSVLKVSGGSGGSVYVLKRAL